MSKNIDQVYTANPITSNASTDLMYFGLSPYGVGDDAAMTYANFAAQFGAPYTAASLTSSNDTNVTLTLGGTPTTALLHAASITAGWTGTLAVGRGGLGIATTPTNGQIPIGNGTNYTAAAITAGTGISVTNGVGSITVASTGVGSLVWNDVAGTTQAAAVNQGYIISNASQTTVTLPAAAAEGSVFAVQGKGAAGWILQMNTGQVCHLGNIASSSAGTFTSTNQWDSVTLVCVTANTTFAVTSSIGNLTVA